MYVEVQSDGINFVVLQEIDLSGIALNKACPAMVECEERASGKFVVL
jgi:hypothetical protein